MSNSLGERRRWPLDLVVYAATIVGFILVLALQFYAWQFSESSAASVEAKPAPLVQSGLTFGGIYALLLWVIIPLALFVWANIGATKRFKLKRLERADHRRRRLEPAPLVRAKVGGELAISRHED